jgi:hypothetical protein
MTVSDVFMIVAVIAGPILAVQAQKLIELWRGQRERKTWIFKTLMATRGNPLSPVHVQALNTIDLEFSTKRPAERTVLDAWKLYHDHLCDAPQDFNSPSYQADFNRWVSRSGDCLIELLFTMSRRLGYDFDKVQLKKGAYTPRGHADLEYEITLLRRGALEVLYRQRPLPVEFVPPKQ